MNPSLPFQRSAEITKNLRSRNVPLTSLLPFASGILDEGRLKEWNLLFPQKEQWLLEWMVQRLREDDGSAPGARCDPECWKFLLHLLPLSASADRALKKHNFLQLVSKTLSEVPLLIEAPQTINQEDIRGGEVYCIPKEKPSPPPGHPRQRPVAYQTLLKLQDLLRIISKVLLYLQKNMGAGRRKAKFVAVLRGTPEIGAQILRSYLETCQILVWNEMELEEEWTTAVVDVWRGCAWGNPNSKKLSTIFSTSCLVSATRLLAALLTPHDLRQRLEQLIAEHIFSHETFPQAMPGTKPSKPLPEDHSPKDLNSLLDPLRVQKDSLSHIFKIAITSQTKKRKPDPGIVEAIFESITTSILGITFPVSAVSDSDAEIIMSLLAVLTETGTTLPSDTLAKLTDGLSNLSHNNPHSVRWDIVEIALKLDFDIFLGRGNEARASRVIAAVTKYNRDGGNVFTVMELLVEGFANARDLGGFVKAWISELHKDGAQGGVWGSDRIARHFAELMEKALLPSQIEKIFKAAIQEESWVVIDAVLRGVRREETEDKIQGSMSKIVNGVFKSKAGWRGWRALVRGLQIENNLMQRMYGTVLEMRESVGGGAGDEARKILFSGEVLMDSTNIENQALVLVAATKAMKVVTKGWDGSVEDIYQENLGVVLAMGFVGRWMGVIKQVPSDVLAGFVDEFLDMAVRNVAVDGNRNITGRIVWQGMLARGTFYEYPAVKDTVLAALVTKLEHLSGVSEDIGTSLADTQKGKVFSVRKDDMGSYELVLESITKYPLGAVKRTVRERVLNSLVILDASLEKEKVDGLVRKAVNGLIERIWTLGNAGSFLARDASRFMTWSLGRQGKAGRRILRYLFASKEQEQSREFLAKVIELAECEFLHAGKSKVGVHVVKACEIIVEEFWRCGEGHCVSKLRKKILKQLRKSIMDGEVDGDMVGAWRRMWALDKDPSNAIALGLAQNIIGSAKVALPRVLTAEPVEKDVQVEAATKVLAETVMLLCTCSKTTEEAVNTTALVVGMLESPLAQPYRADITIAYSEMVSNSICPYIYLECLESVAGGCFASRKDGFVGPGYWEALKTLISGAKKPEEPSAKIVDYLSMVLSKLTRNLPRVKTVSEFLSVTDCMNVILREKTWAVMQYNIDETLTSVAITSSPSGPQFSPITTNVGEIFLRLCNLTRVILLLHRRRVRGGRYHLVVAALQSLLRCMYKRKAAGERKQSDEIMHPPWLLQPTQPHYGNPAVTVNIPRITEKCADSFNRLLTTFCQPPASSVRGRTRRINDSFPSSDRDRERRDVASCVGSLLGEILKGGLEGGFDGDITVSINVIFDVLGVEGVKRLANTIDREGRAMLRELWDEYTRVGEGAGEIL